MKKYVLLNNKGFTMIEALISLSFLLVILGILPLLFKSLHTFKDFISDHSDYEIIMFRKDLFEESKDASIKINNNNKTITFIHDNKKVTYRLLNTRIYKTKNDKGHITLLNHVSNFEISSVNEQTYILKIIINKERRQIIEEIYI